MDKYLILNADDFGYDAETNEAIETLLKSERITSVSLLAPAPAAEDAADRAKRLGVSVGAVQVPKHGVVYDTLLKFADKALYVVKKKS